MKDFTIGSINKHLITTASPIAIGMVFQALYVLIDLYFVGEIGDDALAGVGAASIIMFIGMGFTQVLTVGAISLISNAVGAKDQHRANLIFNQSLLMALVAMIITLVVGYQLTDDFMRLVGADPLTILAGQEYLYWYLPGLALQFLQTVLAAGLRGTGIVKPTMIIQLISISLNIFLAPVMIAGWLTGHPLGVVGAALSTSISIAVGVLILAGYFHFREHYISFRLALCKPHGDSLKRMLFIGLPAGGEFVMMFVLMASFYWLLQDYGSEAQAAFGIGSRVMQSIFLPGLAIAFAVTTVAGQNIGAEKHQRVRETFRSASMMITVIMLLLTILCQATTQLFIAPFTEDEQVLAIGVVYLQIISLNFLANGIIFTCSGMFQALGNTLPALLSTMSRLLTFCLPALWLKGNTDISLATIWYLAALSVTIQFFISIALLRKQMRQRLALATTI